MFVGWVGVALVNAGFIAFWSDASSWQTRLGHHGYDAGHFLALGGSAALVAALFAALATRGRRHFFLATLALAALVTVLGTFALEDDLVGFVARREEAGSRLPWRWIGTLAMTGLVLGSVLAASLLSRPWLGSVSLALGVGCAITNNLVLPMHYAGIHLYLTIVAATLMGGAAHAFTLPERFQHISRRPWARRAAGASLAAWAALSVSIVPNARLWRELFLLPGSSLVPFLARLYEEEEPVAGPPRGVQGAAALWYQSRRGAPPVPPSLALRPKEGAPIVLLITADAMRADLLRNARYARQLPVLSKLRKRSLDFTTARSPSPSTATTFTALFTGKYYSGTRWAPRPEKPGKRRGRTVWPNGDKTPRLAGLLTKAGVQTVNVRMLDMFGRGGVGQGYSEEIAVGHYAHAREGAQVLRERLRRQGPEPLFAAIHFIDAHWPYNRGHKKGSDFDRYLAELVVVDRALGQVLKALEDPELARRTYVIFSADHGEAFGEHRSRQHAGTMYEELLRVPLLVSGPGIAPRKVDTPVSLMDLGPTILDIFGEPTPGDHLGQSLAPLLAGRQVQLTRPIAGEGGRRMQSLVFPDGYKAILDLRRRTEEVYDLRNDPGETRNLVGETERAESAIRDLRLFFRTHALPNYRPPWRQF
jgi:arylsulfatase A-like enzyme